MIIKIIEHNSKEYEEEVNLRHKILREPLGLKFWDDELAAEKSQYHLCAFDESNKLIGCLLLNPVSETKIKMRQAAVEESMQGKGIGKALVLQSEKFAVSLGYTEIILHARATAVPFYFKLGYKVIGDVFFEVTIPHYKMSKIIL